MGLKASAERNLRQRLQEAEDELQKTQESLCKALCELNLLLPYLPEKTARISNRVILDIEENFSNLYWKEYQYCSKCDKFHKIHECKLDKGVKNGY